MGVYSDLLAAGVSDGTAREIAESVQRMAGVVTVDLLDARLAKMETVLDARLARLETTLTRLILTTMIAMTGIFAVFVSVIA